MVQVLWRQFKQVLPLAVTVWSPDLTSMTHFYSSGEPFVSVPPLACFVPCLRVTLQVWSLPAICSRGLPIELKHFPLYCGPQQIIQVWTEVRMSKNKIPEGTSHSRLKILFTSSESPWFLDPLGLVCSESCLAFATAPLCVLDYHSNLLWSTNSHTTINHSVRSKAMLISTQRYPHPLPNVVSSLQLSWNRLWALAYRWRKSNSIRTNHAGRGQ